MWNKNSGPRSSKVVSFKETRVRSGKEGLIGKLGEVERRLFAKAGIL